MLTASVRERAAYCGRPGCGELLARIGLPPRPAEVGPDGSVTIKGAHRPAWRSPLFRGDLLPVDTGPFTLLYWYIPLRVLRASGKLKRARRPYQGTAGVRGPAPDLWAEWLPASEELTVRCPRCRAIQQLAHPTRGLIRRSDAHTL
jgi:hypothetical protein